MCPSPSLNNWGLCISSCMSWQLDGNDFQLYPADASCELQMRLHRSCIAGQQNMLRALMFRAPSAVYILPIHLTEEWIFHLSPFFFFICLCPLPCSPHRLHRGDQDAVCVCGYPDGQCTLPGHSEVQLQSWTILGTCQHHSVCCSIAGNWPRLLFSFLAAALCKCVHSLSYSVMSEPENVLCFIASLCDRPNRRY